LSAGETKRTFAVKTSFGIRVDRQPHGLAGLTMREVLLRHGQLDADRIDADDGRDLRAARHVVAGADERSATMPAKRRADDGVGGRPCARVDAGARRLQRAVRLLRDVLRELATAGARN
jgi:hypothetical protein